MFKEIINAYMESTGNYDNYQVGYEIHKAIDYDEYDYYDDEDEED